MRFTAIPTAILAALLLLGAWMSSAGEVLRLPELSDSSAWQVKQGDDSILSLHPLRNWLRVGFKCNEGNKTRLLLKKPVPLPEWANNLSFLGTNNGPMTGLYIQLIITDAKGREYLYHTKSFHSFKYGVFYPEHSQRRAREVQFTVPGLGYPKLVPQAGATITAINTRTPPEKPLTLTGIYFEGHRQRENQKELPLFLFRDFVCSGATPQNSDFYYQFEDQEFFGEVTPFPYITPGQFGKWYGQQFNLSWEVVDEYTGQPFLAGGKRFDMDASNSEKPMYVQLAEHLNIPVREKGTYWVRVKFRWAKKPEALPELITQREYRLYIRKGEEPTPHKQLPATQQLPNNYVRIAPNRASVIFKDDEVFKVPVYFWQPETELKDARCLIRATIGRDGDVVKELELAPKWTDGRFVAYCDLSEQPAGAYEVTGALLSGEKEYDRTSRMVGRLEDAAKASSPEPVSEFAPSWQQLLSRGYPLFHLCPLLPDGKAREQEKLAWTDYYRPFLDHAADLSRDIEFQIPWKRVEPLPGVFDWRAIDRFINYADRKRLQVLLYPEYRAGNMPEWLPSDYDENPEGDIFGHNSYLFHGARPNLIHSPAIRDRIMDFVAKMVDRYRSHPGVQGYFSCLEHPGDAPYKGWYEGYSEASRKAFVTYCRDKWKDISAVNQRWGTSFKSWADVDHPRGDVSERFRLDWLIFRVDSTEDFLRQLVETIRARDKKRLIVIYGDGYHDLEWFRDNGCISANGGSHDVMQLPGYAEKGLINFPQRTEDHSPGNWSAYFPTQLDASVFAMMSGGGVNSHCKAFVRTQIPWEQYLGDKNKSLGRYQRFISIWTELQPTRAVPIETFVYQSIPSYLATAKTTYFGWYNSPWQLINIEAAHIPVSAGSHDLWKNGKLLIMTSRKCTILEQKTVDHIVDYVKSGGTVLMTAEAGRHCVETPNDDWVLLRKFGFPIPDGDKHLNQRRTAKPVSGKLFPQTATPFALRDWWSVTPNDNMQTAAFFDGKPSEPAISWRQIGSGKVVVIWAETVIPPMYVEGCYPFMRDVAKLAAVSLPTEASTDLFWTNLLVNQEQQKYYGLVHVGTWQNLPNSTVTGTVQWLTLPDGNYRVSEMISGRNLGMMTAEQIRTKGIPTKLGPREVAIYKMEKK